MGHLLAEGHDHVAFCRGGGVWALVGFARPGPTFGIALVLRVEFAHALGSFIASREDGMDARRPEWTIPYGPSSCRNLNMRGNTRRSRWRLIIHGGTS